MARNARFTLTPSAVTLIATGKVAPAIDWTVDVAPGAPRAQRRDEHGMPLWVIDCLDESDAEAGRASVVGVEVASPTEPTPVKYRPIEVDAANVSLYVGKTGQLVISYTASLKSAARSGSSSSAAAA